MNKSQLVNSVSEVAGLKKKDAESAVNAVFDAMEKALAEGDKIQLIGFGTFSVKEKAEHAARNPATGASIVVPASKNVKFAPSSVLKEKVNG